MLRIEKRANIWYNNRNYSAIRRSVMHYHKVPLLCFLNAATEFIPVSYTHLTLPTKA